MKWICCIAVLLMAVLLNAQKKVVLTRQSAITGISLPEGSNNDLRSLMKTAADISMDMVAQPANVSLAEAEVLSLPVSFPKDSLQVKLTTLGWKMQPVLNEENFTWLNKGTRLVLMYAATSKKELSVYFAERKTTVSSLLVETPVKQAGDEKPVAPPENKTIRANKYNFTTSNFDDGWTAVEQPDYVLVTKGNISVYLFYRVLMTEQMRPPVINVNDYFWNRDVKSRYQVISEDRRTQELMYSRVEYLEGEVAEKQTGKRGYAAMLVDRNSGGALNIVVVAADKQGLRQLFPNPQDLEKMTGYNKFAVAAADLPGDWSSTTSAYTQMYYTATGDYAGMQGLASSDQFFLKADGTYRSIHKGVSGMVGSAKVFQQEYKGKFIMNGNWELSLTNRFEGVTDVLLCHFEAVKNGRLLHLVNKKFSGIKYQLVKER